MKNLRLVCSIILIVIIPVCVSAGDVILSKQRDKSSAKPGEIITYSIAYQNSGTQTLNEIEIIDVIPTNTIFQEATGTDTTISYGHDSSNNFGTLTTLPVTKVKWVIDSPVEQGGIGSVALRVKIK